MTSGSKVRDRASDYLYGTINLLKTGMTKRREPRKQNRDQETFVRLPGVARERLTAIEPEARAKFRARLAQREPTKQALAQLRRGVCLPLWINTGLPCGDLKHLTSEAGVEDGTEGGILEAECLIRRTVGSRRRPYLFSMRLLLKR